MSEEQDIVEEVNLSTDDSENAEMIDKINQIENKETPIKRPLSHRIFAWIVIVLLVAMYVITLIAAISGSGSTSQLFMMSLGSTVVLPGVLWLHIRLWKHSVEKTLDKHRSM